MVTYYVRADGTVTAANKANATSPSSANTSLSMTTLNACTGANALAAGDIVRLSSQGGDFTTGFVVPTGGSDADNVITYTVATGETPTISTTAAFAINTNGKSYITITGLWNLTTTTSREIYIGVGGSNITITNMSINSQASYYVMSTNGVVTNLTLEDITIFGDPGYRTFYFLGSSGSELVNLVMRRITAASTKGSQIHYVNGLTMEDCDISVGGTGLSYSLDIENISGVLRMRHVIVSDVAEPVAIYLDGYTGGDGRIDDCEAGASSTGTSLRMELKNAADIIVHGAYIHGGNGDGLTIATGCVDVVVEDTLSYNNAGDGFSVSDNVHGLTFRGCTADTNGAGGALDGDGFTVHGDSYNITIENCIAVNNTNTAVANITTSSGVISNCYFANNGTAAQRGTIYLPTSGLNTVNGLGWTVKNCIVRGHPTREVYLTNPALVTMDNNVYLAQSAASFASIDNGVSTISWATYHASYEPDSINGEPLVGGHYVPMPNGSSDIGTGDAAVRALGAQDVYGRPKLRVAECIGAVYPQRDSPENMLLPQVQLPTEAA